MLCKIHMAALVALLLTGCVASNNGGVSPPPAVPDPPLTYTPTESSSPIFNIDFNPSNSLESGTPQLDRPLSAVEMLNSESRSKYDALKKKQEAVEDRIRELDNMRRGADIDIINVLSSGGAKMESGNKHVYGSGDLQSVYEPPHIFIQNKQYEREFAVNEIVEKQRELQQINQEIDAVLSESKMSCFPADTNILMSDGGIKSIAEIQTGDLVRVYDIAQDALSMAPVARVFKADNNHYYQVNGSVKATAYERFLTHQGWRKVRDLTLLDELFDGNAFAPVGSLEKTAADLTVYNLQVESAHNFFVSMDGESFLLVHNSDGGDGGGGK